LKEKVLVLVLKKYGGLGLGLGLDKKVLFTSLVTECMKRKKTQILQGDLHFSLSAKIECPF